MLFITKILTMEKKMKKILFILLILLNSNIFAERIYKEFQIDGKTISKWVDADVTTYKYDANGNLINEKYSNGDKSWESWYEYDANGNKIHSKWTNDAGNNIETWYEYDENGNLVHEKYSDGYEYWYNEDGQITGTSDGWNTEYFKTYDTNGNLIKEVNYDSGYQVFYEYDSEGRLIHEKSSSMIFPDNTPNETWYEYDANGNKKIHKKESIGAEYWQEYDAKGNKIYEKNSYGQEFWCEYKYDAKGNLIYKKFTSASGDTSEEWYEYEYNENDKIVKKTYYKTI